MNEDVYGIAWVSKEAKEHWDPILTRYSTDFQKLEYVTVREHIREAALCHINQGQLVQFFREMAKMGMKTIPLANDGGYYRVAVSRNSSVLETFAKVWGKGDNIIGEMLGYPRCCREFFNEVWNIQGARDTCLQMDKGKPYWATNNILLRNYGIRPVFHLPCSFHCAQTRDVARQILNCAGDVWGVSEGFGLVYDVLNWPVKFSALHGVAEITTPVFKIRRATDYSADDQQVIYPGVVYPKFGASGLSFPFHSVKETPKPAFWLKDTWTANGFRDQASMDRAHRSIIDVLRDYILRSRDISVVDMGCGNGLLLRKITESFPNVKASGIDQVAERVLAARENVPAGRFLLGDVTRANFTQVYDIGLISIRRIEEANRSGNEHFLEHLRRWFKVLIVYNYDVNPVKVEAVYHGEIDVKSGGPSSSIPASGPDTDSNEGNRQADEGSQHGQDSRGAERFIPDWTFEGGPDSDKR